MVRFRSVAVVTLLAAATLASSASARVYSVGTDFGNAVFKYGTVSPAATFTAFGLSDCTNVGVAGACYRGTDPYQIIARHSADALLVHPGPNDMQNSFVTFVAPRTGTYSFNLTIQRGDSGDGVNVYTFGPSGLTKVGRVDSATPTFSYTGAQFFTAGQQGGIGVDRGGATSNYYGDSTFVSGTVSVPEPAAWALMIAGFGFVGVALRRRSATTVVA